jgi:hypothetical protein
MRDGSVAWLWLRQLSFFVCLRPGLTASTPARPRLNLPGRKPIGPSPPGRGTRVSLPCDPRAGRKPTPRSARRSATPRLTPLIPVPVILVPVIRAHPIGTRAILAPLIRGMPRLFKAHRAPWATGSISTTTYPPRSRSGYSVATPTSAGFPLLSSSGSCSSCIR